LYSHSINKEVFYGEKILDAMRKAKKSLRPGEIAQLIGKDSKEVSRAIDKLNKRRQDKIT